MKADVTLEELTVTARKLFLALSRGERMDTMLQYRMRNVYTQEERGYVLHQALVRLSSSEANVGSTIGT